MTTVRDKLWMWGHPVNAHGPTTRWKTPRESRITPVEAACYMGTPNMHMVWAWRPEAPEPTPSWKQYALPFNAMKRVVWSIAHGHGLSYTDHIFPLIAQSPNVTGVIVDDFFTPQADGRFASLTEAELAEVHKQLNPPGKPKLDLWCVVYEQDMPKPIGPMIEKMDVLAYFMWNSPSVPKIESHFEALEKLAPHKRKALGLYLWDYEGRRHMPMDLVVHQSEVALKLLKAGRIEAIIFVASCICDLELEAVEWTRKWIAEVADQRLA
jgi:hypothetical protein